MSKPTQIENVRRAQARVDNGAYCPSPEEIARVTAEIRAGWTEREMQRAAGIDDEQVELKLISDKRVGKTFVWSAR